jgi:hypothetical protein
MTFGFVLQFFRVGGGKADRQEAKDAEVGGFVLRRRAVRVRLGAPVL